MMSVMNNNQPEIQGDTTNLPNPDQPFDGIERDSRISTEEEYRDSSPAARKTETTSRVWEDRSSISLEEMDVAAEKARIFGEPSGSSQINLWVETRVSEALGKHNMSIGDAMVEKPRDEHLVDDDVLEVSAERDSSTHSYDSYCLDSSELSSTPMGNWSHGLEKGDMVWGKVKSHPWWPGVIFNDALASPAVRRMRKKGLVLVAFFGDNSYGWFDPAELVPFNPYFAEKSRQTTSRNFVKAVEEAVERSSRTRALGLTCRCRNKFNFRPTSIPGYLVVDVVNSEFSDVYSTAQIKNARDAFVPGDMMNFLKQVSTLPMDVRPCGKVEWSNNIAMLLSLRKVLFEEFDETYAQAFGVDPVRPSHNALGASVHPFSQSTRAAPLSGPLVYAEALGGKKRTPGKSTEKGSKDKAKKDKYLFKRRDDAPPGLSESTSAAEVRSPVVDVSASAPEKTHITPEQGDAPGYFKNVPLGEARLGSVGNQAASALPTGEFVLQKRVAADVREGLSAASSSVNEMKLETPVLVGNNSGGGDIVPEGGGGSGMFDEKKPLELVPSVDQMNVDRTQHIGAVGLQKEMKEQKNENEDVVASNLPEVVLKKKRGKRKGWVRRNDVTTDQKLGPSWMPNKNIGEGSGSYVLPELQKNDNLMISAGKPMGTFDFAITPQPPSPLPPPPLDLNTQDLNMSLILNDMLAFALDPFHGSSRNAPLIVRNVFLRFRNLVFQKSLAPPPPEEADAFQVKSGKSSGQPDILRQGVAEAVVPPVPKQAKHLPKAIVRPDDPTKSGRKRPPSSDRQEPVPAKKGKKLKKLKELESEKKPFSTQKAPPPPDSLKEEGGSKRTTAAVAASVNKLSSKPNVGRKQDPPLSTPVPKKKQVVVKRHEKLAAAVPKVPSPTYLFMKFPPRATLPSISSMKARFARFGPLDLDGARVYWGSYTCKMLFKYRADAQTAYMYANDNEIFGPFKVNYSLRDLEEASDDSFLTKRARGDDPMTDKSYPVKTQRQTLPQQSANVQLKSCLKKASSDGAPIREAPRVKFLLDGGEAGRREPMVVPGRSGMVGNDISSQSLPSKNLNSVKSKSVYFPPPKQVKQPPTFSARPTQNPLQQQPPNQRPSYYGKGQQQQKQHFAESTGSGSRRVGGGVVDISTDMLILMRKCSDIVSNVRSAFGYVPYHAL